MYYIYLIVNKVNGKTYVGQRKSSKECHIDSYMGSGKLLNKAKKKYGKENFEKFLIQHCYSKEETDKAERFWIAEYRRRGKAEYNIADGGQGSTKGFKGKHHSKETKKKISEANRIAQKGKTKTEEWKRKISESNKIAHKGKLFSEKHKQNLSESHKGKHWKLIDGKRVWY